MNKIRPSVRLRLTLLYGALFLVSGVLLLALMYALLSSALEPPPRRQPPNQNGQQTTSQQGSNAGTPTGNSGVTSGGDRGGPQQGTPTAGTGRSMQDEVDDARRQERLTALREVKIQAGIALTIATAVALLLGWLLAGRVLRPIRSITAHARRASVATLGDRIDLQGPPDELKELADTIDAMLSRLHSAFESQRRFAAQASHELRTPLAIIRSEADVALGEPDVTERERLLATAVGSAADRSERLVDGLLALSRSESTLRDDVRIDLAELVGDVVGELASTADAAGVDLDLELETAQISGDRTLIERMVGNLVENAIRYNYRGGWVRVSAGTEEGEAVVRVDNSGPVIDAEKVTELFEPFRRGSTDRRQQPSGYGLGLAIVRSVATVHGGRVTAVAAPDGGLGIDVRIPSTS